MILQRIEIFQRLSCTYLAIYCSCLLLITNHSRYYLIQPIGALNPERLKKFQERYSTFEDPIIPKFHYGSHYSSAGTVYLLNKDESNVYLEYWLCKVCIMLCRSTLSCILILYRVPNILVLDQFVNCNKHKGVFITLVCCNSPCWYCSNT